MKQTAIICRSLFWFLTFLFSILLKGQDLDHVPGEFIVELQPSVSVGQFQQAFDRLASSTHQVLPICQVPSEYWLVTFDPAVEHEYKLLDQVRQLPQVRMAQLNHLLTDRLLPNDPQFGDQWHFYNSIYSEFDLDAAQAWDITTGGLTYAGGDTIVVCVIDEGMETGHEDLNGNIWFNFEEIPNNGIDDDGNGYIDDYRGWNVVSQNDVLDNGPNPGWHGTPVAGVIGATGNNDIGVSGANWQVKVMTVVRGITEAQTIAAYSYPYLMRKRYNETNGELGAFVVATNTSWGIDFGQPEDAPLWCSFYDSLGTVGILNVAATINGNFNVDQVGDLPTSCPSDFLISVTNLTSTDQKHPNAGFGLINIDLGAYGTDIWTTKKNNSYGSFTGTSAAAPMVSGAVALLYAAPCPDISWYAKNDPANAALLVKSYILNGTTSLPNLEGITVSGGKLNLHTGLTQLMDDCAFTACFPPGQISVGNIENTSVQINGLPAPNNITTSLRYRPVGATIWWTLSDVDFPLSLNNLQACTEYEFQLQSHCTDQTSGFTPLAIFKTDGCCEPPSIFATLYEQSTGAGISWTGTSAADHYTARYRQVGNTAWTEVNTTLTSVDLTGLVACSSYELQVKTHCLNGTVTAWSASQFFQTSGCDICLEANYCAVATSFEPLSWISHVQLNDLDVPSGSSANGYTDFTGNVANLTIGNFYEMVIDTDYESSEIELYFQIWIDFNQDGLLEEEDLYWQSSVAANECIVGIAIPHGTPTGITRMRVAARAALEEPCGTTDLIGEVEDFCVQIWLSNECIPPSGISVVHGLTQTTVSWLNYLASDQYHFRYRLANSTLWITLYTSLSLIVLEDLAPCTEYEFQIRSECDGENSEWSALQPFTTLGCGGCLDLDYCVPEELNTSFEWIARFTLNQINNSSGAEGYADFNDHTTSLIKGNQYFFEIEPGFAGQVYDENYTVWIDYNMDGSFDDLFEKVFEVDSATTDELILGAFEVPSFALEGSTRLRVSMKYYSPVVSGCEDGFQGEVEDYCINIYNNIAGECPAPVDIDLNTVADSSAHIVWDGSGGAISYQFRYRMSGFPDEEWASLTSQNEFVILNDLLPCTEYEYQIRQICENGLSPFTEMYYFNTDCTTTHSENRQENEAISIFPNPFDDNLWLQTGQSTTATGTIYNLAGQPVRAVAATLESGEPFCLKLPGLPPGLYLLQLQTADEIQTFKIVKEGR